MSKTEIIIFQLPMFVFLLSNTSAVVSHTCWLHFCYLFLSFNYCEMINFYILNEKQHYNKLLLGQKRRKKILLLEIILLAGLVITNSANLAGLPWPLFCWENNSSTYSQRNCTQKDYWLNLIYLSEKLILILNDTIMDLYTHIINTTWPGIST